MTAPLRKWEVLPHGKLIALEKNILTVEGELTMPLVKLRRRMTVVRLRDGRLVVFSAVALDEDQMQEIEAFGRPAFLIVPNDHHRLDCKIWKDRFPGITVIAPPGACNKVMKVVGVDATHGDFDDPDVRLVIVSGTRAHEVALEVSGENGMTLIVGDIIANIHDEAGFGGWLLRIMGFAGDEPHVPGPVRLAMIGDKKALAAQLRRWAQMPLLRRIVVSHGDIIENDPQGALRALAEKLD